MSAWRCWLPGLLLFGAGSAHAFPEGADPGHTGFEGQPDCSSCHYAGPPPGRHSGLSINGLPQQIEAGAELAFSLRLLDQQAEFGGFQLMITSENGRESAGKLNPTEDQQLNHQAGHDYLGHATPAPFEGAASDLGRQLEWTVHWTAPSTPGKISIYASAVAADGDRSALGDNAYQLVESVEVIDPEQ